MLNLQRKRGERVLLLLDDGREIWLTVLSCGNSYVNLGFEAPADVIIRREELIRDKRAGETVSPG